MDRIFLAASLALIILVACGGGIDQAEEHFNNGFELQQAGQFEEAIAEYDESIRLDPDFIVPYSARGATYMQLGQYGRAIEDLDEAIRLRPNSKQYSNRGAAYSALGQYERAIEDFDEAVRLQPQTPLAYVNRALTYALLGKEIEAQNDIDRAVELGFDGALLEAAIEEIIN